MITHDKAGTGATTYETLGWTIKKENLPMNQTMYVQVKLESYGADHPDLENPGYVYGYFCISKEVIYEKISKKSEEWAKELYQNGGMVYLDGIMTVKEQGKRLGEFQEDGTTTGEIYFTYQGISTARNWENKYGLLTHFNKGVTFAGNPSLLENGEIIPTETVDMIAGNSLLQENKLGKKNQVRITSQVFDVAQGIPSGETVTMSGNLIPCYYRAIYEHHYGTVKIPVTAYVTYQRSWGEEGKQRDTITITEQYLVERSFSYWRVRDLELYQLKTLRISNASLEEPLIDKKIENVPSVVLRKNQGSYLEYPSKVVHIQGGTLQGNATPPAIPYGECQARVNETVGYLTVHNDLFSIGEVILLDSTPEKTTAKAPDSLQEEQLVSVWEETLQIPAERYNGNYPTKVWAIYEKWDGNEEHTIEIENVSHIFVHTPVVCKGKISNEIQYNQQVIPTRLASLILGRSFQIAISSWGSHKNQPGYGTGDYSRYKKYNQICFPFEVMHKDQVIPADTWISIKDGEAEFFLPITVKEGDYMVACRTVAQNAQTSLQVEPQANLNAQNDAASDEIEVHVCGRLYDFGVTNVIDYPRWQNVFWNEDKTERSNRIYYAGDKNLDGEESEFQDRQLQLPILQDSHPYDEKAGVVGLGYELEFSLKTIGSMSQENDGIIVKPRFFYVDRQWENRREVWIYEKENFSQWKETLILNKSNRKIIEDGCQEWEGSYLVPGNVFLVDASVDMESYMKAHNGRISTHDEIFLKKGYLIVQLEITSISDGTVNLSYGNGENVEQGYCNMWSTQGFALDRTWGEGKKITLEEGDVFVFDLTSTILTDYESMGTH